MGKTTMNAPPDLQVRLSIREALTRIGDASRAADDLIAARLTPVIKELQDILAHLAPEHSRAPVPCHLCSGARTSD
jgi:hypothetical protein